MARRSPASQLKTYGLTHLALGVSDIERAFAFYEAVFGMVLRSPLGSPLVLVGSERQRDGQTLLEQRPHGFRVVEGFSEVAGSRARRR